MNNRPTATLLCLLVLASLFCGSKATSQDAGFDARRSAMLDMLSADEMLTTPVTSESYAYRRAWMHHDANLAKGVNLSAANAYFANSPDIVAEEWQNLMLMRTYYAFKDSTVLEEATKTRMRSVLQAYKNNFDLANNNNPERYGTKGNHSIVGFSSYLLADQLFGNGPDHNTIVTKTINWVQEQGRRGRDEVNSTHYLERSLTPLLNLYDYTTDPKIKTWSQMAIDQLFAESAVMSLKNVRGGPWVRSHQGLVPGHEEMNDGRQDSFYVAGYQFFGHTPLPDYVPTEQVTIYSFLETTSYRPPQVIVDMANSVARGTYQVLGQRQIVKNEVPDWNMYYHMAPSFSLSAVQDRAPLDNVLTNNLTQPADYVNNQVWELSFSDPLKILGAKRNLAVNTSLANNVTEPNNPNTANMQYKNVLFYKGEFLDYNGNLTDGGGEYLMESLGNKELHYWRVATPEGDVFVGATEYPAAGGGILEVREAESGLDFSSFIDAIRTAPSTLVNTGNQTSYTSTMGDQIVYSNPTGNHGSGTASVNGAPFALSNYPQYGSPYLNSGFGTGTISANFNDDSLFIDFRNHNNPIRTEVSAPVLDADFDLDGDVDGRDFMLWQRGNSPNPFSSHDLAMWKSQYGTAPPLATSNAVPEASTWTLLSLAAVVGILHRRRPIPG